MRSLKFGRSSFTIFLLNARGVFAILILFREIPKFLLINLKINLFDFFIVKHERVWDDGLNHSWDTFFWKKNVLQEINEINPFNWSIRAI